MTQKQYEMMRTHLSPSARVHLDEDARQRAWLEIRALLDDVNLKNIQYNHLKQYQYADWAFDYAGSEYIIYGIDKLLMHLCRLINKKILSMPMAIWDAIIDIDCIYVDRGYGYEQKIR